MRVHRSCSVLTHLGMVIVTSTTFEELKTTTTGFSRGGIVDGKSMCRKYVRITKLNAMRKSPKDSV